MQVIRLDCNSGNCGGSRSLSSIKYLVFHYTGNINDTAKGNANYFHNNKVSASAHYFVDDTTIYQSVPDYVVAWAVGGTKYANSKGGTMYGKVTNSNSISIEMCGTGTGTSASEATMVQAAELGRQLMKKYNIPLENVYRHYDVTGKLCPAWAVDADAWSKFKHRLEEPTMAKLDNTPASYAKDAVDWAIALGILKGGTNGDLMLSAPVTRQQMLTFLYRYEQARSVAESKVNSRP